MNAQVPIERKLLLTGYTTSGGSRSPAELGSAPNIGIERKMEKDGMESVDRIQASDDGREISCVFGFY